MGFFDNLGKKASKAYDATAEKTSKIAKEAKLRMKINENKSEIKDIYKEIGKKRWRTGWIGTNFISAIILQWMICFICTEEAGCRKLRRFWEP